MMSLITLQKLIDKESKFKKSPTIQKIFNYSSEQLKLQDEIELDWKNIVCKDLFSIEQDHLVKELFLYILDCNVQKEINEEDIEMDYVLKNKRWFDICIGIDYIDPTFQGYVDGAIKGLEINLNYKNIIEKIKTIIIKPDVKMELEKILKNRLMSCSKNPRTLIDKIFNTISFNSNQKCDKKKKDTVLYLYEDYKGFLNMEIEGLSKLEKTAILIFCEERQHILSKYISVEVVRQRKNNTSQVKSILSSIYKEDKDIIIKNDEELEVSIEEKEEMKERNLEELSKEDEIYDIEVNPTDTLSGELEIPESSSGDNYETSSLDIVGEEKKPMFGGMIKADTPPEPGYTPPEPPRALPDIPPALPDTPPEPPTALPDIPPALPHEPLPTLPDIPPEPAQADTQPEPGYTPPEPAPADTLPIVSSLDKSDVSDESSVFDSFTDLSSIDDTEIPDISSEGLDLLTEIPNISSEYLDSLTETPSPDKNENDVKPLTHLERTEEDSGKLIISGILEKCGQLRDDINKKNYLTKEDLHHISDCDEKNIPII